MPGGEMTSLIQRVAQQARLTFRSSSGLGPSDGGSKGFAENVSRLSALLSEIRAEDLKIRPRKAGQPAPPPPQSPPVTYMHICETDCFSMGVFLLKGGASIPLHDHPGMHGMLKVLYGTVRISGFDKMDPPPSPAAGGVKEPPPLLQFNPPLPPYQRASLRRAWLRTVGEFSESSGPCLLSPHRDNLHQISAVGGPSAFLDILAPPYDPEDGRDCHYYQLLQQQQDAPEPAGKPEGDGPQHPPDATAGVTPLEVWLLEIPQPGDFWCGGEPYPGPKVSI
ncbi:2-aminoethanethiol dioxygenase [Ascaphus truei]|uniref:2-aminoethanethiol dioxygenase n=1 Tax=Ascaphus truei TaxID=8439 RepID=UPI003F59A18F